MWNIWRSESTYQIKAHCTKPVKVKAAKFVILIIMGR